MSLKLIILLLFCNIFLLCDASLRSCPAGTKAGNDNKWCYKYVNIPDTFDNAEYTCQQNGGHLVQVNDLAVTQYFAKNARDLLQGGVFWTGGHKIQIQNNDAWVWTYMNATMTYFEEHLSDSGAYSDNTCISISSLSAEWETTNCSALLPYICQIPTAVAVCDPGWTYSEKGLKCLKVFSVRDYSYLSFAEEQCVALNGHLASIHSEEENDLVAELTAIKYDYNWTLIGVWFGLETDDVGTMMWKDGTAFDYQDWIEFFNPQELRSAHKCAAFYPYGVDTGEKVGEKVRKWDYWPCSYGLYRYICQKDALFAV